MNTDTVTLSRAEYENLIGQVEDLQDALHMRKIEAEADDREYFPVEVLDQILAGEHPLRVWREHRGLTMKELAERSGVPQSYISEIETGKKPGSVLAFRSLAEHLGLTIDDIVPANQEN